MVKTEEQTPQTMCDDDAAVLELEFCGAAIRGTAIRDSTVVHNIVDLKFFIY